MMIQNTDSVGFNNKETQIVLRLKTSTGGAKAAEFFNMVTLPDINVSIIIKVLSIFIGCISNSSHNGQRTQFWILCQKCKHVQYYFDPI